MVVDVDDREMRLPVAQQRADGGLVDGIPRLVMAMAERHGDEIRERVRDDEQHARGRAVALRHPARGIARAHMTRCNDIARLGHEVSSCDARTTVKIEW